ncbi:ComEC/Rec2 family competence protein [Georgenia sp. TF02-10]|uniref:ComEC/Rec2 family competence protein n=1 Tax=Georgenia sp. TF02-10 TaxID=2917725 RepID=UPI001FA6F7F3|nr:ComEC/Rec2 family competence protein [Georgenia sp. TF02-10]UNX53631.1 ComEC/Rec2 family competence protein [Georgenia sp. TF02-10]
MPRALDLRLVPPAVLAWAAVGLALGQPASVVARAAAAAGALAVAPAVLLLVHRRARPRVARHRARAQAPPAAGVLLGLVVVAAVLAVTAARLDARERGLLPELVGRGASTTVTGRVAAEPQPVGSPREWHDGGRFRIRLDVIAVAGRGQHGAARAPVVVLGPSAWASVPLGAEVRVRGTPAATAPGDPVMALLSTDQPPEVRRPPGPLLRVVGGLRDALRAATADLAPQAQGLVPGIAVGDDRALPADLRDAMRATSLTHLTAVSGAHVAIVLGAVLGALSWLPRRWRAGAGCAALVAFVLLVRPEASVLRSATMGAVVLLALLVGRPSRALPALAAGVVALLLADPWLARSYGFALSVLATAGLVLLARPLAARLGQVLPRGLAYAVAVPTAAQLACGPVVVLLTPALATYAVPANVLAAPAVPPATVLGVAATVLAPVWPAAAHALVTAASWCTAWIATVATTFAALPAAQLPWPPGLAGLVLLAAGSLTALVVLGRLGPRVLRRARPVLLALAVLAALVLVPGPRAALLARLPDGWPPPGWRAIQCDVGQGAAFLLRSGPAAVVMVDVGPAGGGAAACLRAAGVRRVDLLVLTHAHADHVGALPEVLGAVGVAAALLGPGRDPPATVAAVQAQLDAAGVPVHRPVAADPGPAGAAAGLDAGSPDAADPAAAHAAATAGAAGRAGDVSWEVLWPTARATELFAGPDGVNDLSLVLRLDAGGLRALALGDVELAGQAGVVQRLRTEPTPGVDLAVMAHHGSARQDPALARLLAPRLTVVGVGTDNDYGHPAPAALALYARTGRVLPTSTCGPVALVDHGGRWATVARCPAPSSGRRRADRVAPLPRTAGGAVGTARACPRPVAG